MASSSTGSTATDTTGEIPKLRNFIDGKFVAPQNNKYIDSFEPATGKVLLHVPDSDASDIEAAVAAAQRAFPGWSGKTAAERSAVLLRIADGIERRLEEFAAAESRDQGKTLARARAVEIPRAVLNFRFFATAVLHHEDSSTATTDVGGTVNYVSRSPVGVAGLISPWNLPLYLLSWKVAPAIATGNVCVCKPSELTSWTAALLCEVLAEAGLPAGVVNVVMGVGPSAGQALVAHPDVPLISFTGGTKTAEHLIRTSAPHYKKLSLELGGKNPCLVFADAVLDEAVPTIVTSCFANQGEICLCSSRIYVQRAIYDDFVRRFVEQARKVAVVGDPAQPGTFMGPLISADHRSKVESYVELARAEGGRVVLGGERPPQLRGTPLENGYYYSATVIVDLPPLACRVQQEEIFGPVVTISPFDTEADAIALANGVKFGLSASLWTASVKAAHRVAHAVHAGTVWVNCWMVRDLRVPFGGVKQSGVGREGGKHSIDFFTEPKTICIKYE